MFRNLFSDKDKPKKNVEEKKAVKTESVPESKDISVPLCNNPIIIDLKNITQKYNNTGSVTTVFDNFNLSVYDNPDEGQFVVLIGASGCGKSTILRYIAGLQKPTSGEIIIKGKKQTDSDKIGMVFQQYSSLPWRTVMENVALALEIKGVSKTERETRAMEFIKIVGLEGHENKYAKYPILSGGQLQRVAIARNLIANEDILLMDEPFGALDVNTRLKMQDSLVEIWRNTKGDPTIILVTHDLSEAVYLAHHVVILNSNPGRIEEIIKIDLPKMRDSSIKRTSAFSEYVHYLEDVMVKINKSKN
ncbi:MAG: ABC transporter ATP-binding protein [Bacteroidia bacterium]|nr:ABC transporter ATP-binding protein [Bacteroidia bacterium]